MKWWDQMPWSLCSEMLSFKPTLSLSSFIFIKRLFSSLLSSIRVVSSAYLRLLIFLQAILIPPCPSYSLALWMMFSLYKLNKQGDNVQPWHTPFPIWNQSVDPCLVLTIASWSAYRFLKKQVRWYGIPIPQFVVIYTVKGFGIINKAKSSGGKRFKSQQSNFKGKILTNNKCKLCWDLPQGHRCKALHQDYRSRAQNQGHTWGWLSAFVIIAKSPLDHHWSGFLTPNESKVPPPRQSPYSMITNHLNNLPSGFCFLSRI